MLNDIKNKNQNLLIIFSILIVGLFLRLWISQFGYNHDFVMWKINLDLFTNGESFYAYEKYNYSPFWIYILYILDSITFNIENTETFYRYKIIIFLSIVDFFIFLLLKQNYSLKIGLLFFFNPISIFITGYHNQFDNIAILLGFISVLLYQKNNSEKKIFLPLILLGLSLCMKHILFFFPIWLFFKEKKINKKITILLIPYSIFFLSFVPYYIDVNHIIDNVFLYKSLSNGPFWTMFAPEIFHIYFDKKTMFSIFIIFLGILVKKRDWLNSYLLYLISIVTFSSAIANQYFAIPLLALAIFWNWKYIVYTTLCCLVFLIDGDALNIKYLVQTFNWNLRYTWISYYPIILFLFIGLIENYLGKKKYNFTIKKALSLIKKY